MMVTGKYSKRGRGKIGLVNYMTVYNGKLDSLIKVR